MLILDKNKIEDIQFYLVSKNQLSKNERVIEVSIPGQGNMNYVIRVHTNYRTFVMKQSRDYVEKYPQLAAPVHRAQVEGKFYNYIAESDFLSGYMPKLMMCDQENNILILEDLGNTQDFSYLYQLNQSISANQIEQLIQYLAKLHTLKFNQHDTLLSNTEMKKLNHEHIFHYPFMIENGFDLNNITQGLQDVAMKYKTDDILKQKITALGDIYLTKSDYLLHGDYYPGSWLDTQNGIKIIDPEFCFWGCREFDLSIFMAHLILTNHSQKFINLIKSNYPGYSSLDAILIEKFCGVEIMRRLIGLAQLPLNADLKTKINLLQTAYSLINQ